jgi:hypothetical protein
MKKKEITIHKRNEIIRGTDMYSLNAKRCLNAIYYLYQKSRNEILEYEKRGATFVNLNFVKLRELMNLQKDNNYVEIIKDAIRELQTTLIELNNWTNPITNKKYSWYATKFLNDANVDHSDRITVSVEISTLFKQLMREQVNFTKLDLLVYANRMRTKYSMKLYEYLMSFKKYYYIEISQKHLMKLFNIKDDDKTYKNYSDLKRLLDRQLREIARKTDLKEVELQDSPTLSKQKIFRIKIHKKKTKEMQEKPGKELIQEMLKKMVQPMRF